MSRFLILSVCVGVHSMAMASAATPPNFVLIVVDDLGYGDLGCYGHTSNQTPNIDRLAAQGLRFSDFHSNGSMCTPTRVALLTGLYQHRFGRQFEAPLSGQSQYDEGLPLEAVTIAEALKQLGYATGMYGKWHLGYHPPLMPSRQGFDDFRGLVSGDGDHHAHIDRSGRKDWWHNESIEMQSGYSTDLITEYSIEFIKQHHDRPFFLYVPHLAIHFPWQRPAGAGYRTEGTSYHNLTKLGNLSGKDVGEIARSMVESVDESIGRIVGAIKEHELERQTLVFFTSDNGGYLQYQGGYHNISSNGVWRGQKGDVYEGGHRVPAIAWWPGQIEPGTRTEQTSATFDLFPTLAALAGASEPTGADGVDLTRLLLDGSKLPPRALFWRNDDDKAVRHGNWKLVAAKNSPPELFDLASDPSERNSLAAQRPERVAKMQSLLATWESVVDSERNK